MEEIWVVYQDGMMGAVKPEDLQPLIEQDEIIKFQRSEGWAYLTIDPVRRANVARPVDRERRGLQYSKFNQVI